jgi:hypothetical protein
MLLTNLQFGDDSLLLNKMVFNYPLIKESPIICLLVELNEPRNVTCMCHMGKLQDLLWNLPWFVCSNV